MPASSVFDLAPRRGSPLVVEKTRVRKGPPPPRLQGGLAQLLASMDRGDWILLPHGRAKSAVRTARQLGGTATRYQVSELQSCMKVLEAPWRKHAAAA